MSKIVDKHGVYFVQLTDGKLLSLFAPDWAIGRFATYENVSNRCYPVWVENVSTEGWYFDGKWKDEWLKLDLSSVDFESPLPQKVDYPLLTTLIEEVTKELDAELIQRMDNLAK